MKTLRYLFFLFFLFISCGDEETPTGPIANFGYTIDNLIVSFSDSSVAGEGVINKWLWDFGDGTPPVTNHRVSSTEKPGEKVTATVAHQFFDEKGLEKRLFMRKKCILPETLQKDSWLLTQGKISSGVPRKSLESLPPALRPSKSSSL